MRIDKYLKNSRIIKRRTVAKSACDKGLIKINEKIAKAGDEVVIGDIIEIKLGTKEILVKVLSVNDNVSKDEASSIYERIN
ncbi:RNA-binding S4 domain-containing protein [Peptoniphilus lacrimalis]|uniref:RQC P-site tRNA stabilizing factor n=1 Tax=Peptoniphilus lacrimalis TaxID=33031 RepID=A0A379C555_9FIRM|nr:RNA-binding S4 domain-containing protein [Peptoniphilus lacrimalis]MDK8282010.1 RNA-binding S4 domain-containing protein [Peptoniphilus lacrimalis]SUB56865.1 S4 domain [Peptoniphilus lacrimalis]